MKKSKKTNNAPNEQLKQNITAPETKPENAAPAQSKAKKKRSPMSPIQRFLLNALIIVTAIWLLFGYVFGLMAAPNADMSPNIKADDMLLYYHLDRDFHAQDVVILEKNQTMYVGRIVACGGDTVEITDDHQLVINGNTMVETNVYSATPRYEGFVEYPVTLGEGEYFILSDSRNGGEDSRYYGTVAENEIQGKVITVLRRNHL